MGPRDARCGRCSLPEYREWQACSPPIVTSGPWRGWSLELRGACGLMSGSSAHRSSEDDFYEAAGGSPGEELVALDAGAREDHDAGAELERLQPGGDDGEGGGAVLEGLVLRRRGDTVV